MNSLLKYFILLVLFIIGCKSNSADPCDVTAPAGNYFLVKKIVDNGASIYTVKYDTTIFINSISFINGLYSEDVFYKDAALNFTTIYNYTISNNMIECKSDSLGEFSFVFCSKDDTLQTQSNWSGINGTTKIYNHYQPLK